MLLFKHARVFFSEVPRIGEVQDPKTSPRREEVGRRTLRDYGGFLLSFFYRARFQLLAQHFLVFVGKASKTVTRKPLTTSRAEESTSPRRGLHF